MQVRPRSSRYERLMSLPLYEMSAQVASRLTNDLQTDIMPMITLERCQGPTVKPSNDTYQDSPWHTRYLGSIEHIFEGLVQGMEFDDSLVGHVLACNLDFSNSSR